MMKFDFDCLTVVSPVALSELLRWIDRQPSASINDQVTVFVDSTMDFCAVEFVSRPFEHTSRAHPLIDIIVSPYVPCVVHFWRFRDKVKSLALYSSP